SVRASVRSVRRPQGADAGAHVADAGARLSVRTLLLIKERLGRCGRCGRCIARTLRGWFAGALDLVPAGPVAPRRPAFGDLDSDLPEFGRDPLELPGRPGRVLGPILRPRIRWLDSGEQFRGSALPAVIGHPDHGPCERVSVDHISGDVLGRVE